MEPECEPQRDRQSQREPGRAKERAVLSKREPEGARKSKKASQTDLPPTFPLTRVSLSLALPGSLALSGLPWLSLWLALALSGSLCDCLVELHVVLYGILCGSLWLALCDSYARSPTLFGSLFLALELLLALPGSNLVSLWLSKAFLALLGSLWLSFAYKALAGLANW